VARGRDIDPGECPVDRAKRVRQPRPRSGGGTSISNGLLGSLHDEVPSPALAASVRAAAPRASYRCVRRGALMAAGPLAARLACRSRLRHEQHDADHEEEDVRRPRT